MNLLCQNDQEIECEDDKEIEQFVAEVASECIAVLEEK